MQPTELGCWHFLPTNMLEVPENRSFALPKAHSRAQAPGSTVLLQILPDILMVFQINKSSCTSRDRSSSWLQQQPVRVCQPSKPGLLLQPRLEKQLPSGSCSLFPTSKLWQFQGHWAWSQALTAETAKFSLANPAAKSYSSSDPSTLSSSSSYMWFPCGCLQGVWSKEQSPQELYMAICVCPVVEETITGWNGHRGETDNKKGPCL